MDEVIDLLQAWGLPDLEDSFKKNQINIHSLAALSNENIKEFIPQLGPRSLFLRCWKVWQAEFSPHLSSCNISLSLVSDFEDTYSENVNNFYLNFPTIRTILIELLKKKGTKDNFHNEVIQLADSSTEENQNIAAILSLPELIKSSVITLPANTASDTGNSPAPLKRRKTKDHKWKPTKTEHREAFITHVQDDSYFKLVISKKHQDIMEKGFTPQPYIVIIGPTILNIKSYYVVLNPNIFYNLPNILASIDTCFKITWALNLEYSPLCYGPWLFLQKGLYKLSSPCDKGSTPVESLMTDCKLAN